MPSLLSHPEHNVRGSRAERARRLLAGVGISREDSDDELGYEDHPWEWIYERVDEIDSEKANGLPKAPLQEDHNAINILNDHALVGEKRNAHAAKAGIRGRIVGAQMGGFRCRLGDCVLLKAEGTNEAWVGLICEFQEGEDDQGKMANIMWFSTEKEIKNKQKKRLDFMQVRH